MGLPCIHIQIHIHILFIFIHLALDLLDLVIRMCLGLLCDELEGLNTAILSGQALSHLCLAYVAGLHFLTYASFLFDDD